MGRSLLPLPGKGRQQNGSCQDSCPKEQGFPLGEERQPSQVCQSRVRCRGSRDKGESWTLRLLHLRHPWYRSNQQQRASRRRQPSKQQRKGPGEVWWRLPVMQSHQSARNSAGGMYCFPRPGQPRRRQKQRQQLGHQKLKQRDQRRGPGQRPALQPACVPLPEPCAPRPSSQIVVYPPASWQAGSFRPNASRQWQMQC